MTREAARRVLPPPLLELARRVRAQRAVPPPGRLNFGQLRRLEPLSRCYGYDRGQPIDRHYIEGFLQRNAASIRGRVLEVGDATYTQAFGSAVTQSDVLHVREGAPGATFVADLAVGNALPSDAFDCVILTQTLHLIFDMSAALHTLNRILKPGGLLLATVPGITQISDREWNSSWYWSLSEHAARRLCGSVFVPALTEIESFGNVLAATCVLQGLGAGELSPDELAYNDPEYPVTVTIKARKAGSLP